MKNVFIFGASVVHGVGGEYGGWADKIKWSLHQELYGAEGKGEVCEVYELGAPATTLADTLERFIPEMQARTGQHHWPEDTYIIFSGGTNESKAVDLADNHPFSPEDFAAMVHSFLHLAKNFAHTVIAVGLTPVNEAKTAPIRNQIASGQLYFSNERIRAFELAMEQTCATEGAPMISLFDQVPADWTQNYLFADGLHPNDKGHEWIRSRVEPELRKHIGPLT